MRYNSETQYSAKASLRAQYSIFPSFQSGAKRIKFTPYLLFISPEINICRHLENTIIEDEEEHEDEYEVR
jgi:hypothetical protein